MFSNKLRKEGAIKWPPVEIEMKEGASYPRTMTRARQPPAALIDQAYAQITELVKEGNFSRIFHAFQYYRDIEKAKETGLGGPLGGKGWNKVQSLQFGSIAAKPSWKQKAAMIVELLGTISALFKLNYFTRGQQILDIFLDSKPIVQAWEGKS